MKKTYQKPEISFVDFQLAANIALNCAMIVNATETSCGYNGWGESVYADSLCTEYCYQPPTDNANIFAS